MKKIEIVKVNFSSSFLARARCSACGQGPAHYYFSRNPISWYDPINIKKMFEFIKLNFNRLSNEDYRIDDFIFSARTSFFNHSVNYKGYKPRLHRTKGVDPSSDVVEFLICNCGKTAWAFAERSIKNRPEIINRKSRYHYC